MVDSTSSPSRERIGVTAKTPGLLAQLSDDMADVVELVRKSLVQVRNGRHGAGAGSVWHPDGLIITNAHVAQGGKTQIILSDGRSLPARVVAQDTSADLAALAVEASGLPAISLGDSKLLHPGEVVLAMGHPWGVTGAVTAGVVIGSGPAPAEAPIPDREWIAASLRLRPGHSGGPMMDTHGRLVGINTMITGPEVAMAVPVHVVKAFLRDKLRSEVARL